MVTTRRRATVHCIDCERDLGAIRYEVERYMAAHMTADTLAREHRAGYGPEHRIGVIVVDDDPISVFPPPERLPE